MKAIRFAKTIVVCVVGLWLFTVVMLGKNALQKAPLSIEMTSGQEEVFKGTAFTVGEYSTNLLGINTTKYAVVNGKVEQPFVVTAAKSNSFQQEEDLSRFPIWHRPNLTRNREWVNLEEARLYYSIQWKGFFTEKAEFDFHYSLVNKTKNEFVEKTIPLTFETDFGWSGKASLQRRGNKVAVLVPIEPRGKGVANGEMHTKFLGFVFNLETGEVMEQKIMDFKDQNLHVDGIDFVLSQNRAYNPEIMLVSVSPQLTADTTGSNGMPKFPKNDYYTYDYFTNTLQSIDFGEVNREESELFYIVNQHVYLLETQVNTTNDEMVPASTSDQTEAERHLAVDQRTAQSGIVYQVNDQQQLDKMGVIAQDMYGSSPILAGQSLVYIEWEQGKNYLTAYSLQKQAIHAKAAITYEGDGKVFYQEN